MQRTKKSWKASGKRHTTSPAGKETPGVSQLESEKPVMPISSELAKPLDVGVAGEGSNT